MYYLPESMYLLKTLIHTYLNVVGANQLFTPISDLLLIGHSICHKNGRVRRGLQTLPNAKRIIKFGEEMSQLQPKWSQRHHIGMLCKYTAALALLCYTQMALRRCTYCISINIAPNYEI